MFVNFLIFVIASIGMAHILVDGSIFSSLKTFLANETSYWKWGRSKILEAINCYQCSGFWAGIFIGALMWLYGMLPPSMKWEHCPIIFVYGCASAYLSTKAAVVILWMQSKQVEDE